MFNYYLGCHKYIVQVLISTNLTMIICGNNMTSSVVFQIQSFLIVGLMLFGVYHRKNRYKHIKTMKLVIIWDLLLVAQIELTRSAILKASKVVTNPTILNIHVSLAVSTVLLYAIIFYTGTKLKNGNEKIRKWHKSIGILTVIVRISTLVTSNLVRLWTH